MRRRCAIVSAWAVCCAAGVSSGQPVLPGQTARTQTGFTGFTVPGVNSTVTTNVNQTHTTAHSTPAQHSFAANVQGGFSTFAASAQSHSEPAFGALPPLGHGASLSGSTSLAVTNSRVLGSTYSSSATAIMQDSFLLTGVQGPFAILEFTFSLDGSLSRSDALAALVSRVTVSAQVTGQSAVTLYNDALGATPTLNGVPVGVANPNELSRTIAVSNITFAMQVPLGSGPVGLAFSMNVFNSFATGTSIGSGGSASANFTSGMELDSIAVKNSNGVLQIPGSYELVAGSGVDYTYLLAPSPGAGVLIVMGGLVASRRRR